MSTRSWLTAGCLFASVAGCTDAPGADPDTEADGGGKADGVAALTYHGGPLMTAPITVHFIYYGDWSSNTGTTIIPDLIDHLGSSPWYKIVTDYTDASGTHPSGTIKPGETAMVAPATGFLSDIGAWRAVSDAIDNGSLPEDDTAIYLMMCSRGIIQRETDDCGWHDHHKSTNGTDIKYAWVGDFGDDKGCNGQPNLAVSPNNNPGADQIATNALHELAETVTDPHADAWLDSDGNEDGDKCINTYGKTFKTADGAIANMKLGSRNYLIQRNWSVVSPKGCRLAP